MKIAYLDCFAGISGDMTLGALVDAGLDFDLLTRDLAGLALDEYELYAEKVTKNGISGTKVSVLALEGHVHRNIRDIEEILERSNLPQQVKDKSLEIFYALGRAEAKIHGTTLEDIHFHEVGAVDAIVDIVGSVIGFWRLGIEKVVASPLHTGKGFVKAAHGILPVPAPATLELLHGVPVYAREIEGELVTPTGAAILTSYCREFGALPAMTVERIGYGAGEKDRAIPNLLRIIIGKTAEGTLPFPNEDRTPQGIINEYALTVEANIDDMNPEIYDYVMEQLFQAGAMDVYLQNIQMKKNRPATILTVLIAPEILATVRSIIFNETSSIGLRVYPVRKHMLERSITTVETEYGPARLKTARMGDRVCTQSPEYEDCKRLARENNVPLKRVYEAVKKRAAETLRSKSVVDNGANEQA